MNAFAGENLRVMIIASGDLWAGAEAVVYELCSGLTKHTPAEVTAVFLNKHVLAERCREAGVRTYVIDEKKNHMASITSQVVTLARGISPQVIHSHRYKENIIAAFTKGRFHPVRLVSTVHGRFENLGGIKVRALSLLNAWILAHAFSAVVAVSHDLMNYLRQDFHIPDSRVRCVANGIRAGNRAKTNIMAGDTITIGSAGRLVAVKDYPFMVDVAKELCKEKDNARFLLAGEGPEVRRLQQMIEMYGLGDRFKLLGHVQDMEQFYRSIDVYLTTSRQEGMPMTLLEAMSHGVPVVAPDLGGLRELINSPVDGILVKEKTDRSFANALIKLMDDRVEARSMGIRAWQKIGREFSSEIMVQRYHSLYMSLL